MNLTNKEKIQIALSKKSSWGSGFFLLIDMSSTCGGPYGNGFVRKGGVGPFVPPLCGACLPISWAWFQCDKNPTRRV
jgi:hypothetical protein